MRNSCRILVRGHDGKYHLGGLSVGRSRILKRNVSNWDVDRIYMAKDRNQWRVLMNMIMKLRVP